MSKQTLPERLREVAPVVEENFDVFTGELLTEAADEIERLRTAIAREVLCIDAGCDNLRAALAESSK